MDEVNEKSTAIVTCMFTDEDDTGVTPTSASYRIDDKDTGTEITTDTPFSPGSSTHDIEITPDENAMVTATRASEIHRLTLSFIYTGPKTGRGEYKFIVKNLAKVT